MFKRKVKVEANENIASSYKTTVICQNCGKQHEIIINIPMLYMDGSPACATEKYLQALVVCDCGLICGLQKYSASLLKDPEYLKCLNNPNDILRKLDLLYTATGNPIFLAYYVNYFHEIKDTNAEAMALQRYINTLIEHDFCVYYDIPAHSIVHCKANALTFNADDILIDAYRRAGQFDKSKQLIKKLKQNPHKHKCDEMYKWLKIQKQLIRRKNTNLV